MIDLWPHQREAVAFAQPLPAALLGCGMGTGKSRMAARLLDLWACRRVLILCPASVRPVWLRELERWSETPGVVLVLGRNSIRNRTRWAEHFDHTTAGRLVVVANYEMAWRDPFASWALAQSWDCVICDESHRLQRESRIASWAAQIGHKAARRLCLTGTPFTQSPASVWAQCRFLEPDLFGDDLKTFLDRHHNPKAAGARIAVNRLNETLAAYGQHLDVPNEWMGGTIHPDEFHARLNKIALRIESADVLDLPPITPETIPVELRPAAKRAYRSMERELLADLGAGRLARAGSFLARAVRLQQITSGFLPDQAHQVHRLDHSKADALRDLLADAGEPVVVFARFRHDLDTIRETAEALGLRYGEISHRSKAGLDARARMAPNLDVVGVQAQSGGTGVDLSAARLAVFYSLSWSLAEHDQAVKRIHRPPQARPCVIYYLVAADSIDQRIVEAIQARREILSAVFSAMRRLSSAA